MTQMLSPEVWPEAARIEKRIIANRGRKAIEGTPTGATDRETLMLEAAGEVVRDALAALRTEFQKQLDDLRVVCRRLHGRIATLEAAKDRPKKLRITHDDGTESIISEEAN